MAKHTAGPWKAHELTRPIGLAKWQIHWSDDGECVADVVYEEADAKLIAAAPELLEACRMALDALGYVSVMSNNGIGIKKVYEAEELLKQAIAKAEGGADNG